MIRARAAALAAAALVVTAGGAARAETRPRFEPTDLAIEPPGVLEADLQLGAIHGDGAGRSRLLVPDFEIDLGLTDRVEIDLDGTFTVDDFADRDRRRFGGEPLWAAVKLALLDQHVGGQPDGARDRGFGLGLQLGPRLPGTSRTHGVGYQSLALLGATWGSAKLALNAGGMVDTGAQVGRPRPVAATVGLDLAYDLSRRLTVLGELGAAIYASDDPNDFSGSLGIQWATSDALRLSAVLVGGLLPGGDRVGLLLGITPKLSLF